MICSRSISARSAAYDALPQLSGAALAGKLGQWTLVVEPNGFQGSRLPLLADLASAGRAMSVFWNVNGGAQIAYAEHERITAVIRPVRSRGGDGEEGFLQRWEGVAELDEDWRVGALSLAETVVGQRLGEVARRVRARLEDVERDLLAQSAALHDSGLVEPGSPAHRLIVESRGVRVTAAALNENPARALWEALWYAEMLQWDSPDRIRLNLLRSAYGEIEQQG